MDCATGECVDTGVPLANGASCGAGSVCFSGNCNACSEGSACAPANVCHVGKISCETGQPVCDDTGTPVTPGATCGTNQVCSPAGSCESCMESASCESPNPCRTASIRCASGAPVCTDAENKPDGASCGTHNVCLSGTCAACPVDYFSSEVVDSGGAPAAMGFALGADGVQHAAYYDIKTRAYYYATDASGGWVRQQILANDGYSIGDVQLALDLQGHVHVSATRGLSPELWYATNASGDWTAERVFSSVFGSHRIAVDVASNVHIVFRRLQGGAYPYHASRQGGLWRVGRIDDKNTEDWTPAVAAGQDGSLHASWTAGGKVMHGRFRGANWDIEEVAASATSSMTWGRRTAIALDASNHVHIAYTYGETAIRYVTNASGAWVVTTAANATVYNPDPTRYEDIFLKGGVAPSIALDQQGHAHVAWVALPSGDEPFLNHATNASGAWVNTPYSSQPAGQNATTLFVDAGGTVRIGYTASSIPYSPRFASQACPGPAAGLPPLVAATLPEVVRAPTTCDVCVKSVVAVGTPGGLRVDWRPVTGATGYKVYVARGVAPTKDNYATLPDGRRVSASGESLELTGLAVGVPYFIVVTAVTGAGESAESPTAAAKPVADVPGEGFTTPVTAPFLAGSRVVANAGDINHDGYDDLLVGDEMYESGKGQVLLFLGGEAGLSQAPAWTVTGTTADSPSSGAQGTRLGSRVEAAGDVNGDGYADVVVAENLGFRVYNGSASGLTTTPSRALTISSWIVGLASGDFDGDTFADIALGTPYLSLDPLGRAWDGAAYIYRGTASGIGPTASWTQLAPAAWSSDSFGKTVAAVGDVDGDGFGDLIVGSPYHGVGSFNSGALLLFRGSATGVAQVPSWSAFGLTPDDYFGAAVAGLGDVDGDTFGEVAIATTHYDGESRIDFYEGMTGGMQATPFRTWATSAWPSVSSLLEARVDLLGDGRSALLVGGRYRVTLHRGRDQHLEADPVWSLEIEPRGGATVGSATAGRFGGPGALGVAVIGCSDTWVCNSRWGAISYATGKAQGPRVDAGWPVTVESGVSARLLGAGVRRGPDAESACTVDFGDGSPPRTVQPCGDLQVGALAHRYWLPGRYTVTISLTSSASQSSTTVDVTE